MFTIKNIATGETMNVSNTIMRDDKIMGRYQFGTRYFNKYYMMTQVGTEGDQPILQLAEGWEVVSEPSKKRAKKAPKVDEQPTPAPEPTPQPESEDEPKADEHPATPQPTPAPEPEVIPSPQPTPKADAISEAFAALTPLFAGVQANVTANVMRELEPLRERVQAICDRAPQQITHVIKIGDVERSLPGEIFHPNFDDIVSRISAGVWVYLYGPTGSGKNVLAEQVAKALGLDFYYQAHTLDRFELTGFIDANGNYQPSEFYKAYTQGGLFMLDELDASDENALVTLNSASNGYFAFPNGTVKAHPNFRVIAAGNTCGRGATSDYTARRVMDASSLGRFVPRYHGYCPEVDTAAANGNIELVEFFAEMRLIKKTTDVQMILSPRQIKAVVSDEARGLNLSQTLADLLVSYLTKDELNIVKQEIKSRDSLADNKYAKAFVSPKVQAVEY